MEVRPGYKHTDIGVIPEEWELTRLGDIADVISGGTPKTSNAAFWNGGIKWCTPTDITSCSGKYLFETNRTISRAGLDYSGATLCPAGAVLLCSRATIGEVRVAAVDMCTNQGIKALVCDNGVDNEFLYYKLLMMRDQMVGQAFGSTFLEISTKSIAALQLSLPPLPEQQAIAAVLRDVDALLQALDRIIAKKRDLKQAVMQQLLTGQTRLPGFRGEWEVRRLGDHVRFLKNGVYSRADLTGDGSLKYLHYGDIHASRHVMLDPNITEMPSLPRDRGRSLDRLQDGDLIFVDASEDLDGVGKSVEIRGVSDIEVVAGLHTIAARFDKAVLADGFKGYLQFIPAFRAHLLRLAAGTKVYATNRAHIASAEIRLPSTSEQSAIAAVLSDMDAEIAALEVRRDKTRALKQAMMQELLTGRTRLVGPQILEMRAEPRPSTVKRHNWAINEAVVIAVLVKHFGSEDYPLGRKRYTKLSYLLHRHAERKAEGYLKKPAGPYNPHTKYGGPEKIAKENGYIQEHTGPKGHIGFIAAGNIAQAETYFEKWYGREVIDWLEQFRYRKNDDLEVLTTVDMAVEELRTSGQDVSVTGVKGVISNHPDWNAKLDRPEFSDVNIASAIRQCKALFG